MEDYKKKYEEALEVIKENLNALNDVTKTGANVVNIQPIRDCFYKAFPELKESDKESEDERIRKEIISHLQYLAKYCQESMPNVDKWIAWLERQGEQNLLATQYLVSKGYPVNTGGDIPTYEELYEIIKEGIINVDKCEPKFKVGDWITDNNSTFQIVRVENEWYYTDDGDKICFDVAHQYYRLWTIEDAKSGDVLAANECIVLFKEIDGLNIKCHCTYHFMINLRFNVNTLQNKSAFHPATKEQRCLLFKKIKEYGYKWENNQLEEINNKGVVDLGLPSGTLWAICNLGAEKETDFGLFFQWGDIKGYNPDEGHDFNWGNYKWGGFDNLVKYNNDDGKLVLDNEDDPVFVATSGMLKMPTKEQLQELIDYTNHEWTSIDGVKGMKFTNKKDDTQYIFIPAAGYCIDSVHNDVGFWGCLWSVSRKESRADSAWNMSFSSSYISNDYFLCCNGFSVRGVM